MDYKVEDLLKIPFLKNAFILAGKAGMQRSLNWYRELHADGSGTGSIGSINRNDVLILADELNEWTDVQILKAVKNAVRFGAACIVMFSVSRDYQIPEECQRIAEAADLPVIIVGERHLPVEILSREIAMILLKHSKNDSYLYEVFLAQTGEKELSQSDLQVILQCSGYDFSIAHQAVSIGFEDRQASSESHVMKAESIGRIRDFCMNWLSERTGQVVAGINGQSFSLFFPLVSSVPEVEEQIGELVRALELHLPGIRFQAGMGTPKSDLEMWKYSLKEANLALRAMRIFQWDGVRTVWKTQPAALLLDIRDHKQLSLLRNPLISPLYSSGTQYKADGELAHTLEMFFRYGRNRSLTAEKMFLHRNTLNLRLRKIEKLCGVDLSDPVRCREIEFAIYVEKCFLLG